MSIFDYINWVSGYIINKLESKEIMRDNSSIRICFNPVRDNNNQLKFVICEKDLSDENVFFSKVDVNNKEEFYSSIFATLIKYFKNSDLLSYSAINNDLLSFCIGTRFGDFISFSLEDEKDLLVFSQFKSYLDDNCKKLNYKESEEKSNVISYKKIML